MALLVAFSIACAITAFFAFRHRGWHRPKWLVAYFSFFFVLAWVAEAWLMPKDAFGYELVGVCLGITVLFSIATLVARHLEGSSSERGP